MGKEEIEQRVKKAISELRIQKHKMGHPFMINSNDLPVGHCWLEYPNGIIHLVTISKSRTDFQIVKVLSRKESATLRKHLGIY